MNGAHGLPKDITRLTNKPKQVIHIVGKINIINEITPITEYFLGTYGRGKTQRDKKIQERYDKSVIPRQKEGREKGYHAELVDVPKDILNVP